MKTLLSIVLAVLALCSTGLAQKSVIRPPHPLRVFNGTGDGSYPFGHVQEISAPETLNGSNFFMWITIQGGYSIANPRSRTTTVRTLGHPMAVAAIYANAKVWYPDADEPPENQTEPSVGLFLPKKPVPEPSAMIFLPKKPGPERRQMMLKATLEMGELGMGHENRIFGYLGFGLDWFPQQEGIWHSDDVEFYDSPSGRTKLIRGQHLSLSGSNIPYITEPTPIYASRTDSPTSTSRISSTVSRNLSVWYEPKWTTSDMAPRTPGETPREAPKMYVSTPLESVFGNTETWHSYSTVKSVPSVLLPVELRDIKGAESADDVTIQTAANAPAANKEYAENEVAWIEPHTSANNPAPRMPQLELKVNGLPQTIAIHAKLEVQYTRGNGARPTRNQPEDRVRIPADGSFQVVTGDTWRVWQDYAALQFFGGNATLTYKLLNGTTEVIAPQTLHFRIGGKNPTPARARSFIETLPNAGPQGTVWFAYAIAKTESKDYNDHGTTTRTRYNQFLTQPMRWGQSLGRPVWGNDGGNRPGGYGMFQVTSPDAENIPREQIWNWQENARGGVIMVTSKRADAAAWMTRQKNASNANGIALPSLTIANVTFAEGSNRTMIDAITMKANNGASAAPSSFTDTEGPVTGFIIDPQSGGHFCYWKNSASGTNKWALSRYNNPPPGFNPFNYTLRVCNEVE
jgi:hypothetical protein